jgi:hypothetical protein
MPSRRSSRRSHVGCAECKVRHVKCDETLPICHRCLRNARPCSLSGSSKPDDSVPRSNLNPPGARKFRWKEAYAGHGSLDRAHASKSHPQNSTPEKACQHSPRITPPTHPDYNGPNPASGRTSLPPENEDDLYQHFMSVTCHSLAQGEQVLLNLYQDTAPSLAMSRPYLMDCILGISGHHRLWLMNRSPDTASSAEVTALRRLVLEYQNCALHSFLVEFSSAESADDCAAACIASILVLFFSFANRQLVEQRLPWALSKLIEILRLQAGISAVIESKRDRILQSQVRPLLDFPGFNDSATMEDDVAAALGGLEPLLSSQSLSELEKSLFSQVLIRLKEVFRAIYQNPRDVGNRLGWVRGKDASLLADLLEKETPESLVLVSYWAASFASWSEAWWEMGLGKHLIEEVQAKLPAAFQSYLAWPLKQCQTWKPDPGRS